MSSVRLSAALSPVGTEVSDHLINGKVGADPFPSMQADPIGTQTTVCEAITQLIQNGQPEISQLDALLALDRQAQSAIELLLTQYVEGDGQIGSFEWKAW